jgi:hypothetical protein
MKLKKYVVSGSMLVFRAFRFVIKMIYKRMMKDKAKSTYDNEVQHEAFNEEWGRERARRRKSIPW